MGVNYGCCIVYGFLVEEDKVKTVLAPEIYEQQPIYDTRTGKVSSFKKCLVKDEEVVYKLCGLENICFESLCGDIAEDNDLTYHYSDDDFVIGYDLFESRDYGRADLADGEVTLSELQEHHKALVEKFPELENEFKLFAVSYSG